LYGCIGVVQNLTNVGLGAIYVTVKAVRGLLPVVGLYVPFVAIVDDAGNKFTAMHVIPQKSFAPFADVQSVPVESVPMGRSVVYCIPCCSGVRRVTSQI